jgi:hypothetical protein
MESPDLDPSEIEWLAKKLFGRDTAGVVTKIMELERSIAVNEEETFNTLFGSQEKLDRINDLTDPDERDMLIKIREGYLALSEEEKEKIKAAQPTRPSGVGVCDDMGGMAAGAEPEEVEPQATRVKEVDLRESEDVLEDLKEGLSGASGEFDKEKYTITPRQFVDEFLMRVEKDVQIIKGSGEIKISPNPKRRTQFQIKGLRFESGVLLDLTFVNDGRKIKIKRDRTYGPEVRLPKGKLFPYAIDKFYEDLTKLLNSLSEKRKLARCDITNGEVILSFNVKF